MQVRFYLWLTRLLNPSFARECNEIIAHLQGES